MPGCTLRFAEVLAKIGASSFRIDDLLYFFNATPPPDCDDPFPPQDPDDALYYPSTSPKPTTITLFGNSARSLLVFEISEEDMRMGLASDSCRVPRQVWLRASERARPLALPRPAFLPLRPRRLFGSVSPRQRQYRTSAHLAAPPGIHRRDAPFSTTPPPPHCGCSFPWRSGRGRQAQSIPPAEQRGTSRPAGSLLRSACRSRVPRVPLSRLAERGNLSHPGARGAKRWLYFHRHFALANARRKIIAQHLGSACRSSDPLPRRTPRIEAGLVLSHLFSDENTGTPWESDAGGLPR